MEGREGKGKRELLNVSYLVPDCLISRQFQLILPASCQGAICIRLRHPTPQCGREVFLCCFLKGGGLLCMLTALLPL